MNIHVSQLPIVQTANGDATWRFEIDNLDVDLIREAGKFRFEVKEQPATEEDFDRDLSVKMPTSKIIDLIQSVKHHGDLYDPKAGKFLGILI